MLVNCFSYIITTSLMGVGVRNNDRYSELTGETPVVDGCLRETMTGTVN